MRRAGGVEIDLTTRAFGSAYRFMRENVCCASFHRSWTCGPAALSVDAPSLRDYLNAEHLIGGDP